MVPVITLTGYLGAGKTTVLNHLLRRSGARIGVVINDFGAINVDAGLVTGHVDEAAAITGGCVCCLPDAGGLDAALEQLTRPQLRLDAVIVEASGAADPFALARLIRFSTAPRARPGGLTDVVDAVEHARTVDVSSNAPARYAGVSLVVTNKLDRLPAEERARTVRELTDRVHDANPDVPVVPAMRGRIDPALVHDVAQDEDPPDQLPIAALLRSIDHGPESDHVHAGSVTVPVSFPVDATRLVDLLEAPPPGVYRLKGCLPVGTLRGHARYLVNVVGRSVHVVAAPAQTAASREGLVAIGFHLDEVDVRSCLAYALQPADHPVRASGVRRIERHLRRAHR